jgi:bilin biosynthesis protein
VTISLPLNPHPPTPEATDALLQRVTESIDMETFDPHDETLLAELVEALGDTRGVIRLRVAETLGQLGTPATPFLIKALREHPNVVVRRAAGKTITLTADRRAIPALLEALLHDEDTVVKGSAVGAMARMGDASIPILFDILASTERDETMKGHAAWALAFIGVEAKPYLSPALASPVPEVRSAAIGVLVKVVQETPEDTDSCELLIKSLADEDENVRSEAAAALGNLAYQPAFAALVELLHHQNSESRKAAALALMKLGNPEAIPILESSLDREETIVPIIKLALSKLRG